MTCVSAYGGYVVHAKRARIEVNAFAAILEYFYLSD